MDKEIKFWSDFSVLVEEGKCELLTGSENGQIYMSLYYPDMVNKAYRNADDDADMPFPSEHSLGITIPESQTIHLTSEVDILSILETGQEQTNSIYKIVFPDDFGSALALADMIPRQLTEMAILKVRNYLKRYGNKEYIFHKLMTPLQGRDSFLQEQLDQIIIRPLDSYNGIKDGRELSYLFWAHLCSLAKTEIKRKTDLLPMDIAAFQSFFIIDLVNGHYKSLAVKRREKELAFKHLESQLAKPPYHYSMVKILGFNDSKGKPLLGQYSTEELEEWVKKQTTESKDEGLPSLLLIKGLNKNENAYLLKEKMLPLCVRLLASARKLVNDAVLKQWSRLMLAYKKEPSMENDEEFEEALRKLTKKLCPDLLVLLEDPRLFLVYEEVERTPNGVPITVKIFNKGKLLPFSSIFFIRRKDVLQNVKYALPIWHSLPIISAIIAFFKKLARKRKESRFHLPGDDETGQEILEESSAAGEIRAAAEALEFAYIPPGYTPDTYLEELEDRWSRLINRKARENLVEDVQYLARDNLRRSLKIDRHFKADRETITQMAENMVLRNQALASLSARDSLLAYLELYLIKLLKNIK